MTATLTMSHRELERCEVLRRVHERRLTQREASEILGLSLRQTERLCARYRRLGPEGLLSAKRGKPSNRQLPAEQREVALALVRARYADFGPNWPTRSSRSGTGCRCRSRPFDAG